MHRLGIATVAIALVATLTAGSLWAETHSFKLLKEGTINGTALKPGSYKLELNGQGEALIYRNGQMVAKSRVEVRVPAAGDLRGSVLQAADGSIREIRLNKQVVVFVR